MDITDKTYFTAAERQEMLSLSRELRALLGNTLSSADMATVRELIERGVNAGQ